MSTISQERANVLNELLRGELSAVETYQKAMDRIENDPRSITLTQIRDDHREAANELRRHVREHTTEEPSHDSGSWGEFAGTVQRVANFFGDDSALRALREGEEHGINEYEDALEEKSLTLECREAIREKLLPQARRHVAVLNAMMESS